MRAWWKRQPDVDSVDRRPLTFSTGRRPPSWRFSTGRRQPDWAFPLVDVDHWLVDAGRRCRRPFYWRFHRALLIYVMNPKYYVINCRIIFKIIYFLIIYSQLLRCSTARGSSAVFSWVRLRLVSLFNSLKVPLYFSSIVYICSSNHIICSTNYLVYFTWKVRR